MKIVLIILNPVVSKEDFFFIFLLAIMFTNVDGLSCVKALSKKK